MLQQIFSLSFMTAFLAAAVRLAVPLKKAESTIFFITEIPLQVLPRLFNPTAFNSYPIVVFSRKNHTTSTQMIAIRMPA